MKINKNGIIISLLMLSVFFLIAALILSDEFKTDKNAKVILIPKVYDESNDFWMSLISGAKSAAKEFQVELTILAPDVENDYKKQKEYIYEAIRQKPDVIALTPIMYSEMTEEAKKVKEAGIKLILIDSKIDEEIEESYIGTNNIEAGIQLGTKMLEYVKKDTKIAIVSHVKEASTAIEREKGVREGLGKEEGRIQTVLYSNSDYDQAYILTKQLMQEHPDIDLIVGLNLYSTVGVARAINEMKLGRKVNIVGFDNDIEGIRYLESGVINALIVQKPFNMGYFGIQKAAEAVAGNAVERTIYSETEIITVDNIYISENQKLLFPF